MTMITAGYRVQWMLLGAVAAFGAPIWLLVDDGRAALSFLGGVAVAGIAFSFGIALVRAADRVNPALTFLVAMISYTTVAVAFAAIFARSDPDVLQPGPFALGLVLAVFAWIYEQWRIARPPEGS